MGVDRHVLYRQDLNAELEESINSMFRWYAGAKECYAYLKDLDPAVTNDWQPGSLCQARWFGRGWTLQELIAPVEVVFFGARWERFGRRSEIAEDVSRVTRIPISILKQHTLQELQTELSRCSVAQRMSWAAWRDTTRLEDRAYSLLGIFNIVMKLLYGERERAFRRLQERILRETCDFSILAWHGNGFEFFKDCVLWAENPDAFARSQQIVRNTDDEEHREVATINIGIRVTLPLVYGSTPEGKDGQLVLLSCHEEGDIGGTLALKVHPEPGLAQKSLRKGELTLRPGWLWTGDPGQKARYDRLCSVYTFEAAQHKDPQFLKRLVIRHDNIKGMAAQLPGHAVGLPANVWVGARDPKARL